MKYDYAAINLTPEEIRRHDYKQHLGGGSDHWDRRGRFQLALMQWLGLRPSDCLLDFGCGPLRGGIHFIRFLAAGAYVGVDANASFVDAAKQAVVEEGLSGQSPRIDVLADMDFRSLDRRFDFVLCFSVLNHCDAHERELFLARASQLLALRGQLVITHAAWLHLDRIPHALRPTKIIGAYTDLPPSLDPQLWGFNDGLDRRLPIVVLAAA